MPSLTRRRFLAGSLAALGAAAGVLSPTTFDGGTRGRGDAVSVTRDVSSGPVELLDGTNYVRYPDLMSDDGVVSYGTMSIERWGEIRSASAGVEVVLPTIERRFGGPIEGVGRGVESRFTGLVIAVDHVAVIDGDGAVISEPNVAFDRLVDLTPRTVRATLTFDGREFTGTVPVIAQHFEVPPMEPLVYSPNGSATTPSS